MDNNDIQRRRLDLEQLLLRSATERLNERDEIYLDMLLTEFPDVDAHSYDRAVAAIMLTQVAAFEPMPETVRRRIATTAKSPQST